MFGTVGVVGCGRWGSVHIQTLLEMRSEGHVKRVVVADTSEENRSKNAAVDAAYASLDQMCQVEFLDLVIVATPNATHEHLGMASLGQGIRTLIEKPIASSPEGLERLIAQATQNDCFLTSGYLLRHHGGIKHLKQEADAQAFGTLQHITYRRQTTRPKPTNATILEGLASHGLNALDFFFAEQTKFLTLSTEYTGADATSCSLDKATHAIISFASSTDASEEELARIEVGWGAEKEVRELHARGSSGTVSIDFGQHQFYTLNGVKIPIKEAHNPLVEQILSTLAQSKLTQESCQELRCTSNLLDELTTKPFEQN